VAGEQPDQADGSSERRQPGEQGAHGQASVLRP
jgi:hypothetical protein